MASPATSVLEPQFESRIPHETPLLLPLSEDSGATDAAQALESAPSIKGELDPRQAVHELVAKTLEARPQSDALLLERAYEFAYEKHIDQKRKTGEPYINHPVAVAGILAELGMDDVTIAAGFLHDVVEDCGVTYEEMQQRFGADVAHLVEGVTKLKRIQFSTKADKQAENLRKLFLAMAGDVRVIIVKLADRLHNMRTIEGHDNPVKQRETAEETLYIFAPIAHRLGIWRIKWELEDLSFKQIDPDHYKQIYKLVQETRAQRNRRVEEATQVLQEKLHEEGIEAEVNGRPKHFFSIAQKMIKQGLKFEAIHDLTALRIITDSNRDCYHALGVVHGLWMPIPEMFFDYISQPKPNNYRSLHTKVLDGNGDLLEVQIRTREMHREAEFGIAAHWRYKGEGANAKAFGDRLRWLRPVLELNQDTVGDGKSYLDSLKMDLSAEQVFVFTPDADVVYLPVGSTPVDFAYRVHSEIGAKCTGAKVNGRIVPLNYKLHNGDICTIVTSPSSKGPKRGWLDFVVTPHAKSRIKAFLRRQSFDDNFRYGIQKLEKAARADRLKLGNIVDIPALKALARQMGHRSAGDLVAAIGYGELSAENILNKVRDSLSQQPAPVPNKELEALSGQAANLLQKRSQILEGAAEGSEMMFGSPGARQTLEIDPNATGDLSYHLSRCCAPIAGDKVSGYITRGRGISVHRTDCSNLRFYERREPARIVPAKWGGEAEKGFPALIAIEASDRNGLLADVTVKISEKSISISAVNTYPLKRNRARLNIAISVATAEELQGLMNALRDVAGVTKVHRV